jgi:hypothetical protein
MVTVGSTAIPGTTGTVKFSAPGYADGVVKVTVDQSTNLVVDPASLSIPANGAESFKVKLAKAPTAPVTVAVTPSTPDLTTTPASPDLYAGQLQRQPDGFGERWTGGRSRSAIGSLGCGAVGSVQPAGNHYPRLEYDFLHRSYEWERQLPGHSGPALEDC